MVDDRSTGSRDQREDATSGETRRGVEAPPAGEASAKELSTVEAPGHARPERAPPPGRSTRHAWRQVVDLGALGDAPPASVDFVFRFHKHTRIPVGATLRGTVRAENGVEAVVPLGNEIGSFSVVGRLRGPFTRIVTVDGPDLAGLRRLAVEIAHAGPPAHFALGIDAVVHAAPTAKRET